MPKNSEIAKKLAKIGYNDLIEQEAIINEREKEESRPTLLNRFGNKLIFVREKLKAQKLLEVNN